MANDETTNELLQAFGYDPKTSERLRQRLRDGLASATSNRITGNVTLPAPEDVFRLPDESSDAYKELRAEGERAIRSGEVGCIILAGGMATRFGGVVKAAVDALPGHSFLALKLAEIDAKARALGAQIPVYLMTSFATHGIVSQLARELSTANVAAHAFPQGIALRLFENGEIFRDENGELSPYAPGHGDLPHFFRTSGHLAAFQKRGGKVLMMSNVDNLAATLDPSIVGAFLKSGKKVLAEVTAKEAGDKGGAPARVDGVPQIVEHFRFPETFDADQIPVFNTNTLLFDAASLEQEFDLSYFVVRKNVGAREVIQFERLIGEVTAKLPSIFLEVPRAGATSRFQPVKDPDELLHRQAEIRLVLGANGVQLTP